MAAKDKIIQFAVIDKCEYLLEYHLWSNGRLLVWRRDIKNIKGKEVVGDCYPVKQILPKPIAKKRRKKVK